MATLAGLHRYLATVLLVFAVLLALWATFLYFRNRRVPGGLRSSFLIMTGVTALQGLLGLGALVTGGSPREGFLHMVYGIFAVLFLPGAYLYSHGGSQRRETLVFAGACWIVAIAYFRGISTG